MEQCMERRTAPRIPLDTPCFLALVINAAGRLQAMAIDVSLGGVQLALSPGAGNEKIISGAPVTLENASAPLDKILGGASGKIAWVGQRCCGVRLDRDLSIDASEVSDLARL